MLELESESALANAFSRHSDGLRRAHASYQQHGHSSRSGRSGLLSSKIAHAAFAASHLWRAAGPERLSLILGVGPLSHKEFRSLKASALQQSRDLRVKTALRPLLYSSRNQVLAGGPVLAGQLNRGLTAEELEMYVEDWHHLRMWSIESTVNAGRNTSGMLRTSVRTLQESAMAAAYLAMRLSDSSTDLARLVRVTLCAAPKTGSPGS